jgi:hypothetical protein
MGGGIVPADRRPSIGIYAKNHCATPSPHGTTGSG